MTHYPRRVRKRDGREAPFDTRKIGEAIERALAAAGEGDPALAEELACAVALSLARDAGRARQLPLAEVGDGKLASEVAGESHDSHAAPVEASEIDARVERVLRSTGRAAAAAAYVEHRERRARARREIAVHSDAKPHAGAPPPELRAYGAGSEPWSKGKIVSALMMEAELPRELAESVASHVEARVFASGFRRVSTGLLRELVDNELFSRGLETHLKRQSIVGLPKYDLRELLRSGILRAGRGGLGFGGDVVAWTAPAETTVARTVLGKFSVEEVHSAKSSDRHLSGDLHFEGIDAPHRDVAGALALRHLWDRSFGAVADFAAPRSLEETLDAIRHLLARADRAVGGTLVLRDLDAVLAPFVRGGRRARHDDVATRAVRALALGREGGELALAFEGDSPLVPSFVAAAAALPPRVGRPRIVLLPHGAGVASVDGLLVPGDPTASARDPLRGVFVGIGFSNGEELAVAPGLRVLAGARRARELDAPWITTGGMAILNLPRLAYAAGSFNEGKLLESLVSLVDDAVEGLAERARFLGETDGTRGGDLPHPRRAFSISWVGLRECVRKMCEGAVDVPLARAVVQAVVERTAAVASGRSLAVFVDPWVSSRARSRFEQLDAEQCAQSQLFSDADRVHYSDGATLSPCPGLARGVAEGQALAGVAAGVLPAPPSREEMWDFAVSFGRARSGSPVGEPASHLLDGLFRGGASSGGASSGGASSGAGNADSR